MDCYRFSEVGVWDGKLCCSSCHDDWEEGYDCCAREVKGEWLDICCVLAEALHQDPSTVQEFIDRSAMMAAGIPAEVAATIKLTRPD